MNLQQSSLVVVGLCKVLKEHSAFLMKIVHELLQEAQDKRDNAAHRSKSSIPKLKIRKGTENSMLYDMSALNSEDIEKLVQNVE